MSYFIELLRAIWDFIKKIVVKIINFFNNIMKFFKNPQRLNKLKQNKNILAISIKDEITVNRSPRFGRDLPRLLNVPHFDGILIHRGNTGKDTSGCILVGENKVKGRVINSTPYELELTKRCKAAIARKEKITIEIV